MKKEKEKRTRKFTKATGWGLGIALALFIGSFLLFRWLICPVIRWSPSLLFTLLISSVIALPATCICAYIDDEFIDPWNRNWSYFLPRVNAIIAGVLILCLLITTFVSWAWFHVDSIKERLSLENISQEKLVEMLPDYNEDGAYSWIDSESAQKLAARKMGELTEDKSLFDAGTVSKSESSDKVNAPNVYTSVEKTEDGYRLVKYIPLKYSGVFAYSKGKDIPGYIKVDPVKGDATFVKKPMRYSPSACFERDLKRHLRANLPTEYFGETMFQVAPDGTPYWITELVTPTSGWFYREVYEVSLCDAYTGEVTKYALKDAPDWVVCIHGKTAADYYDAWGRLAEGYWNFSKHGETSTTDDFGYVLIDNTMYYYTGVTSKVTNGGDESNIGVLLFNSHTGEAMYAETPGAEEYSAMSAAEAAVQNYGYQASFPSLASVNDQMTYIMVLKDGNGIVKGYAMVNYDNFGIVVTGENMETAAEKYLTALGMEPEATESEFETESTTEPVDEKTYTEATLKVDDVKFIVNKGSTTTYILSSEKWYKKPFSEDDLFIKVGDEIKVSVEENNSTDENVVLNIKY